MFNHIQFSINCSHGVRLKFSASQALPSLISLTEITLSLSFARHELCAISEIASPISPNDGANSKPKENFQTD